MWLAVRYIDGIHGDGEPQAGQQHGAHERNRKIAARISDLLGHREA